MLVIRAKFRIMPEGREPFLRAAQQLVGASRKVEGVLAYDICASLNEPDTYVSTEVYADDAAMARQTASDALAEAMNVFALLMEEEPEGEIFEVSGTRPLQD